MHHITEDTPPDMLAGAMDLSVRLPDGKDVNMSVERSTPMMDLLVQVTTAYKLRPSDHIVQALDMSDRERALPFKPNVPIGALDTQRIRVLPKGKPPAPRVPPPPGHQPFESTFRLQVHLPRNQFCVIRVGKHVLLENIMRKVCEEKNLDPRKYEFRHPANIDKVLDPKRTLNDYEITEITVVHRGSAHLSQTISSSDIMALQREEERRKMQAKTGGGVLNLIFRRGRSSMGSGSVSSDTRSISPTQSDDSRSVTPPAVQPPQLVPSVPQEPKQPPNRPKPPQRKRRPAPKPPTQPQSQLLQQQQQQSQPQQLPDLQPQENEAAEVVQELEQCQPDSDVTTNLENGLTICHSRNSSDSSGYHEASILSDNCNTTLPRRPKATVINASLTSSTLSVDHSTEFRKSTGNLSNMIAHSKSTTSLTTAGRKKKAPPPPPVPKSSSVANMATETSSAPVVASVPLTEPLQKSSPAESTYPATQSDIVSDLSLHHPLSPASNFDSPTPPSSPSSGDPSPRISNSSASPITSLPEKTPLNHRTIQEKNPSTALDQNQNCTSDQNQNCTLEDLPDVHKLTVMTTEPSPKTLENFNPSGLKSQEVSKKMAPPQPNYTKDTKEIRSSYESAFNKEGDERTGNVQGPKRHSPEGPNLLTPSGRSQESPEEPLEPLDKSTLEASPGKSALDRKSGHQVDPSALQPDPRLSSVDLNQRDLSMKSEPTLNQLKKSGQILRPTDPSAKPDPTLNPVGPNLSMESEPKPNQVDLSSKADPKFLPNPLDLSGKPDPEDPIDLDTDWQYTLPSPPTAFRDSSPTNFTDLTNYDTVTFNGLTATDSVVTSPALFEKLESIKDQSETGTVASETGSSSSDRILTSKYLSLETLEKRKSLVLERELSSLKVVPNSEELKLKKESLRNEMEEMFQSKKGGGLSRTNSQSREKILMGSDRDSTLPNFKITTYDQPKGKINIFEDDSIRSNVDPSRSADSSKRNSTLDLSTSKANHSEDFPLAKSDFPNPSKRRSTIDISASKSTSSEEDFQIQKRSSLISSSSENVSSYFPKRNSVDDFIFKKPQEVPKFRNLANEEKNGDVVSRSESFSSQKNVWSRSNPVKRSKSHISLDRYKEHNKFAADEPDDGLHKSNSLFNVSGLQSLEVMRMILPKLGNTPPSTPPEDLKSEPLKPPQAKPEQQPASPKPEVPEKEAVTKKYQYSGPPAINLGTWSDRPKSQISLKEDQDYKISNIAAMKSKFNSQTNLSSVSEVRKPEIKPEIRPQPESLSQNFPSVNIRVNGVETSRDQPDSGKINIKINSDPSNSPKIQHQSSGNNVIIKIGSPVETPQKPEGKLRENSFYSRFLNQTTATAYRKPLGNINGVDKPRPHSIAFDSSCPDLSRVPIVRAVELKKPYKDPQNKSITQIVPDGPPAESPVEAPRRGQNRGHGQPHAKSSTLGAQYRHSSVYLSSENLSSPKTEQQNKILSLFSKPVSRVSSFAARTTNAPVVKGFRVPTSRDNDLEGANGPRGHASSKSAPFLPGSSSNLVGNSINFVGHSMNYNATNPAGCAPSPSADNSPTRSVSNPRSVAAISANFAQNSGNLTSATLSSNSGGFTLASRGPASISQNSPAVNSSSVAANAAMFETVTLRKTTNGQPFFRHSMGPIGPTIEPSPPPAPQMPKITAVTKKILQRQRQVEDPRDQLLESIRNFGGKSGLRAVK